MSSRYPQDSDDAQIERRIARVRDHDIPAAQRELAEVEADVAVQLALPEHHFSAHEVAGLKRLAEQKRETLMALQDRLVALESKRSTPEQKAQAEQQARERVARVNEISAIFNAKYTELIALLNTAQPMARDLATLRQGGRRLAGQIEDVVARHGLAITVPAAPAPSHGHEALAGMLIRHVEMALAGDVPDERTEVELSHTRAAAAL